VRHAPGLLSGDGNRTLIPTTLNFSISIAELESLIKLHEIIQLYSMRSSKFLASSASLFLAPMSMALSMLSPITFSEDPKSCLPGGGVTSFSNCPALFSSINYCNEPSVIMAVPDPLACICNQDYLNLLFG